MKSREELLQEFGGNPQRWADDAVELQQQLAEAQALIADLNQQLLGAKAEKLSPEQEEQLQQVLGDVQDQAQRSPPLSQDMLQAALKDEGKEQRQRAKQRRRRTMPPVELEKQTIVLEPPDKVCPISGKERPRIDQEGTTEYDFVPAQRVVRQSVRPQYGRCGQDCCPGVTIAALPPRLLPQSKLGVGPGGVPSAQPLR